MIELESIHKGADWRYQIDITPDDLHADTTTFRLGTTQAKVAAAGTPDVSATVVWGEYGATTALHTVGTIALTKEQTAALTVGLYYYEIISVGTDTSHLSKGAVQVTL
jgi:hypothetical protein